MLRQRTCILHLSCKDCKGAEGWCSNMMRIFTRSSFVGGIFRRLTSMRYTSLLVIYLGSGRYKVEIT